VFETEVYVSMDLLALATGLGMEGQSGHCCCWCRGAAKEFTEAARGLVQLEPRTMESQIEDLEKHKAAVAASVAKGNVNHPNNHNGVSAPSLFTVPFDRVIPPYLHLGLGLVNDVVREMYKDLTRLGCLDPEEAGRARALYGVLMELELRMTTCVEELVDLLGENAEKMVSDLVVKMTKVASPLTAAEMTGGGDGDDGGDGAGGGAAAPAGGGGRSVGAPGEVQVEAGELGTAEWGPLLTLTKEKVDAVVEEAEKKAHERRSGAYRGDTAAAERPRATRVLERDDELADEILAKAAKEIGPLGEAAAALSASIVAHRVEMCKLAAEPAVEREGKLVAAMKAALNKWGISVQRYWNATLVGPDCRRFLKHHTGILADIRAVMVLEKYGDAECDSFVKRHADVLKPLGVVLHETRKVRMLTVEELGTLKAACGEFGAAWRVSYPLRAKLTPKGHIVEHHVWRYAELYGTCGVFGEDGAEAIHVSDSACRRIVRQMRKPEDRHKAHTLHHLAYSYTPSLVRTPRSRRSKLQIAADLANAALAALQAPLPVVPPLGNLGAAAGAGAP